MKRNTKQQFILAQPPKLVMRIFARYSLPRFLSPPSDHVRLAAWLQRNGFQPTATDFVRDDGATVRLAHAGLISANEAGCAVLKKLSENS